jgi:HD-like signal output (HDOD) protein
MNPSLISWTFNCIEAKNNLMEPPVDMREAVSRIKALPPLPGIATRIMKLASDPLADTGKLAEIIELDPLLTTQVIRWASSALYGYKGKITSVQDATNRVLGYQFVFNLVLGLATLKPLKAPSEGVIGIRSFWTHALASTHLMNGLNKLLLHEHRIESQSVFLVALMHNIGHPLLGDQFIDKFRILSNLAQANPRLSLSKLEKFALGVDHCELGSWLLRTWSMPKPIIDVVYHHHNPHYRGENYRLNLLTYLNDSLLAQINIGDAQAKTNYEQVLEQLQLTQKDCNKLLEKLEGQLDDIKVLVQICTDAA